MCNSKASNCSKTTHLKKRVCGVLLEEGAARPLPPGSGCSHLRLYMCQRIEPNRDGASPGQQALQLLQVSVAATTLLDRTTQEEIKRKSWERNVRINPYKACFSDVSTWIASTLTVHSLAFCRASLRARILGRYAGMFRASITMLSNVTKLCGGLEV